MKEVLEAAGTQPTDSVVQPAMERLTVNERLLLKFYRELQPQDQDVLRHAIQVLAVSMKPE
ncbi:hypothetical protein ABEP30_12385 [Cutibacterium acnes]